MEVCFMSPKVERKVTIIMKESKATILMNILGNLSKKTISNLEHCGFDDGEVSYELYHKLSKLLKNQYDD